LILLLIHRKWVCRNMDGMPVLKGTFCTWPFQRALAIDVQQHPRIEGVCYMLVHTILVEQLVGSTRQSAKQCWDQCGACHLFSLHWPAGARSLAMLFAGWIWWIARGLRASHNAGETVVSEWRFGRRIMSISEWNDEKNYFSYKGIESRGQVFLHRTHRPLWFRLVSLTWFNSPATAAIWI